MQQIRNVKQYITVEFKRNSKNSFSYKKRNQKLDCDINLHIGRSSMFWETTAKNRV
jgi:hypothetical protein